MIINTMDSSRMSVVRIKISTDGADGPLAPHNRPIGSLTLDWNARSRLRVTVKRSASLVANPTVT